MPFQPQHVYYFWKPTEETRANTQPKAKYSPRSIVSEVETARGVAVQSGLEGQRTILFIVDIDAATVVVGMAGRRNPLAHARGLSRGSYAQIWNVCRRMRSMHDWTPNSLEKIGHGFNRSVIVVITFLVHQGVLRTM